jgi:hypothetical protein
MNRIPILVVLLVTLAGPVSAQERIVPAPVGVTPYLVLTVGNSLDLLTTVQAMTSGRGQEGNPLFRQTTPAGLVAIKTGSTVAVALLMRHLGQHGHPRLAKVLGYSLGIGLTGIAARNARVGR